MADNNTLLAKVLGLKDKYESLQNQLADPEVISDMKKYVQLNKEYKELSPIIKAGEEHRKLIESYDMAKEIIAEEKDEELREMAKEEIAEIEPKLPEMEQKIKLLLIPAVTGRQYSRETSAGCTASISSVADGRWKSTANRRALPADSRKSS